MAHYYMCTIVTCLSVWCLLPIVMSESPIPGRIPYYIMEELPEGTLIGNVATDSGLADKFDKETREVLRYSFLSQTLHQEPGTSHVSQGKMNLFRLDMRRGSLRTATRIDRDSVCAQRIRCLVVLDVAVSPHEYFEEIKVVVDILDMNDHAPVFPQTELTRHLSEAVIPGSSLPLPMATDPDSQSFSVQSYELVSSSDKFELSYTDLGDGDKELRLFIRDQLDREEVDFYQFKVLAHDGGNPSRSGSVLVNIEVDDSNDNDPKFENSTYEVFVLENTLAGTTVAIVKAMDRDAGNNGRVTYGLSQQTIVRYGRLFGMMNLTGAIYLKRSLDFEQGSTYVLTVTAVDRGSTSRPAHASVIVRVDDVNDNAPQMSVNTLTVDGIARVEENARNGTFVAYVSVADQDGGRNGELTCSVDDSAFILHEVSRSQRTIITATSLDYEKKHQYELTVSCHDLGDQPRTTQVGFTVKVTDMNDHPPVFSRPLYSTSLPENTMVDTSLLKVKATDRDLAENGRVRYRLRDDAQGLFAVHPVRGTITTRAVFDREQLDHVNFQVVAFDAGSPPMSATATVIVTITDQNDEPPLFSQANYAFGVYENQAAGTEVGQVVAMDGDLEETGHSFLYRLDGMHGEFSVDAISGMVYTQKMLDREADPVYYMRVVAESRSFPPMSSTASLTVYVADQNDQPPVILWPTQYNRSVMVYHGVPQGHHVALIDAHDDDIGDNARMSYYITQGNEESLFGMHATAGVLTVEADLSTAEREYYNLTVGVRDHGYPEQVSMAWMIVHINTSAVYVPPPRIVITNNNITIAVSLTSALLLLLFLAIIAGVLYRQQRQYAPKTYPAPTHTVHQTHQFGRTESQKMLHLYQDRDKMAPDGGEEPCVTMSTPWSEQHTRVCERNEDVTTCTVYHDNYTNEIHPHQISDLLTDCQTELQVAGHSDARGCWEPEAKAHMQSHVTPVPPPNTVQMPEYQLSESGLKIQYNTHHTQSKA